MLSLRSLASDERKRSAPVWNGSRWLFSLSCCLWWGRPWLPVTAEVPTFMFLMLCNKFTPAGNQPETCKVRVWWKLWTADRGLFIFQVFGSSNISCDPTPVFIVFQSKGIWFDKTVWKCSAIRRQSFSYQIKYRRFGFAIWFFCVSKHC